MDSDETGEGHLPSPPHLGDGNPSDPDLSNSGVARLEARLKEWNSQLDNARTVRAADVAAERSVRTGDVANERSVLAADVASERSIQAATVADKRSVLAADVANERGRAAADRLAGSSAIGDIVQGYITVCQSSMTNALSRGTFITTAAGAIGTIYTGLLGFRYSVTNSKPLTLAAGIPGIFLGIAILTSATYVAFLKQGETAPQRLFRPDANDDMTLFDRTFEIELLEWRIDKFANWTYGNLRDKSPFLYAAVYSLALAVVLLPIPFVNLSGAGEAVIFIAGIVALVLAFFVHLHFARKKQA